jgi:hypothetical protein
MSRLSRRHTLSLFTALLAGGGPAWSQEDRALRAELERAYATWLRAMRTKDTAAFAATTSRYQQMCLRNGVVSKRQPWPAAVFAMPAPDITRLTFIEATAVGDTARAIYFGRTDFAQEAGGGPENPLIVRFLKENGAWKFDRIQMVNFGNDEAARAEARSGGRNWLQSEEFQLTGRYPPVPKPCKEPYQVAALRILATSCKVTVDVNQGAHTETVENNTGGGFITGGLQKGYNLISITPVADLTAKVPPQLEIAILTRRESYARIEKLWSWKPPEPPAQWKPKYDTSVFVKSRAAM